MVGVVVKLEVVTLGGGGGRGVVRLSANLDSMVMEQKYYVHYEKTTFTDLLIQASTPWPVYQIKSKGVLVLYEQ